MIKTPIKPTWHYLERRIEHEIGANFATVINALKDTVVGLNVQKVRWTLSVFDERNKLIEQSKTSNPLMPSRLNLGGYTIYKLEWEQRYK